MSALRVVVTGAAGFIGSHTARLLAAQGHEVFACDNFNDYYDPQLKEDRVSTLLAPAGVQVTPIELANAAETLAFFQKAKPTRVVHLAAQVGVRYSVTHPEVYAKSNLVAFTNVLEASRAVKAQHLVFASSSSVYGSNPDLPWQEGSDTDRPQNFYAATKKANELMAYAYSQLYPMHTTALRFFTVYGPWGRPDMAPHLFTRAIFDGEPIKLFNQGNMRRDFTFIDDVVRTIAAAIAHPLREKNERFTTFNIGNSQPVELKSFVAALEKLIGRGAMIEPYPMQAGDLPATAASVDRAQVAFGFRPSTPLSQGLKAFVDWYTGYYKP